MKDRTEQIIAICSISLILIGIGYILFYSLAFIEASCEPCNACSEAIKHGENYRMYELKWNTSLVDKVKSTGLYYPSKEIYCVYAANREPEKVSNTEAHEYVHHLIMSGTNSTCGNTTCRIHFCGE